MSLNRFIFLVLMGAAIWGVAALLIRGAFYFEWFDGGAMNALLFILALPTAVICIELVHRFAPGRTGPLIYTAALVSLVGLLMDGLAITWINEIYNQDRVLVSYGAAWLLWIVGLTLGWAMYRDRVVGS